MTKIQAFMYFT